MSLINNTQVAWLNLARKASSIWYEDDDIIAWLGLALLCLAQPHFRCCAFLLPLRLSLTKLLFIFLVILQLSFTANACLYHHN